jgi:hypothetical protein
LITEAVLDLDLVAVLQVNAAVAALVHHAELHVEAEVAVRLLGHDVRGAVAALGRVRVVRLHHGAAV